MMQTTSTLPMNLLEPHSLIEAFMAEPPEDFLPQRFQIKDDSIYGFITELDLFTTVPENLKRLHQKYQSWLPLWLNKLLKPKVLFVGTPVSEYVLWPQSAQPQESLPLLMACFEQSGAPILIIKDLPKTSPLLTEVENHFADSLTDSLKQQGFLIFSGQALAYVSLDFSSRDAYLQKFSSNRRNNFKRRLKMFSSVAVQEMRTGTPEMTDTLILSLYSLYLNVYNNSYIHFHTKIIW